MLARLDHLPDDTLELIAKRLSARDFASGVGKASRHLWNFSRRNEALWKYYLEDARRRGWFADDPPRDMENPPCAVVKILDSSRLRYLTERDPSCLTFAQAPREEYVEAFSNEELWKNPRGLYSTKLGSDGPVTKCHNVGSIAVIGGKTLGLHVLSDNCKWLKRSSLGALSHCSVRAVQIAPTASRQRHVAAGVTDPIAARGLSLFDANISLQLVQNYSDESVGVPLALRWLDANTLAGSSFQKLSLYDVRCREIQVRVSISGTYVHALACLAESSPFVATGCNDGHVNIWDTRRLPNDTHQGGNERHETGSLFQRQKSVGTPLEIAMGSKNQFCFVVVIIIDIIVSNNPDPTPSWPPDFCTTFFPTCSAKSGQ